VSGVTEVTEVSGGAEVVDVPVGQVWDQLVSVALVGTERKPPPADAIDQLASLIHEASTGGDPAELAVLRAAAAVAAYRRVGLVVAHSDAPLPEPAPHDDRPEASSKASQLLTLLLEGHVRIPGGQSDLLGYWLDRCAAGGRRPSDRTLPKLLDYGTRVRTLRPAVVAVAGTRARWLASQNKDWAWAAKTDGDVGGASGAGAGTDAGDDQVWHTGTTGARMALLARRREHDPDGARALVEVTWSGESAKDRVQIVEALHTGLGPADEAFLETCLDDRAKNVRVAAAELLAALPGSQLTQRMADRLRPLVGQRRAGLRKRLEVALPDQLDAAARRDGIDDNGGPRSTGRRTWWLIQVIGATPLSFWARELGLSPADAVTRTDQPELVQGWVRAASRQGDAAWCHELMKASPDPSLLTGLSAEQAHDLLPLALERAPEAALPALVAATPGPWPPLLTQWVLRRIQAVKHTVPRDRALATMAHAGDPSVIPELEAWIGKLPVHESLRFTLADVAHGLSIRQTIAQELS
jgi:hypothetical protein